MRAARFGGSGFAAVLATWVAALVISAASVTALAHEPVAVRHTAVASAEVLQPLAALYEVSVSRLGQPAARDVSQWYFYRDARRIESVRPSVGQAELWDRDESGGLQLRRVFHADKRIVEYSPGDLRAMQIGVSWDALASVLSPSVLGASQRVGTRKVLGREASVYRGGTAGRTIEVWWIDEVRIPARISQQSGDTRLVLTLKSLHANAPADWPRVTDAQLNDYLAIDAADFGDMEGDRFVRKVQQLDALSPLFRHVVQHAH